MTYTTTQMTTPYLNNASQVLPISVDTSAASDDVRKEQLTSIVTTLCPFMGKDLSISSLSGGLSNTLFVVSSSSDNNNDKQQVLVRIQSTSADNTGDFALVDLQQENRIMAWLSQQNMAPTFYGRFENGRVEEFYSGYSPLKSSEMSAYATQIAALLAALHSCTPPNHVLPHTLQGTCWKTIKEWLNMAKSLREKDVRSSKEAEKEDACLDLDYLQEQLDWLQQALTTTTSDINTSKPQQYCREIVFCHMDAQSLNVLVRRLGDSDVKLIDYEYCSWNSRAADIANTWNEYCDMNNLKADYANQYPTPQQQDEFLRAYLHAMGDDDKFDATDYPALRLEVNRHALVSHLLWTAWSLVQSHVSDIDFDYLPYAQQRMQGYEMFKRLYFEGESQVR